MDPIPRAHLKWHKAAVMKMSETDHIKDPNAGRKVDQSRLRVNQAFIIALLIPAFIFDSPILVTFVSVVMLLGTAIPTLSLFKGIYSRVLRPVGLVNPDIKSDNPEPHRFAQGFGGVVLTLAVISFLVDISPFGWLLVWVVIGLAALNLFLGFCAGCFIYYQLNRLNVPGFVHSRVQ